LWFQSLLLLLLLLLPVACWLLSFLVSLNYLNCDESWKGEEEEEKEWRRLLFKWGGDAFVTSAVRACVYVIGMQMQTCSKLITTHDGENRLNYLSEKMAVKEVDLIKRETSKFLVKMAQKESRKKFIIYAFNDYLIIYQVHSFNRCCRLYY
jgi:hypothetical protein